MILFIFEGEDREPHIYRTLERLYFPRDNDNIICSFGNNIYDLYSQLQGYEGYGDIVGIMKERLAEKGDTSLEHFRRTDISQIFLFFDFDFHHSQLSLGEINRRVEKMLEMFGDETENGKLYINYPMIESIRYTKELPDRAYLGYAVTRKESHEFKTLAHKFSFYKSYDHILFRDGEDKPGKERYMTIKDNWRILTEMNVMKAYWLISGSHSIPVRKSDITQIEIFRSQRRQYIDPEESVSVLNSFPIFLYEYFKIRP